MGAARRPARRYGVTPSRDHRALHEGGGGGEGRGVCRGGQRLHREAARPARARRPRPLPLPWLRRARRTQRGVYGAPGEPAGAGQRLATAAHYVRSLLPPPQQLGSVAADWRFIPSAELGGTPSATTTSTTASGRLSPRRLRARGGRGPAERVGAQRDPQRGPAPDRLSRPRLSARGAQQGVSDGAAKRHVFHDLVRRVRHGQPVAPLGRRRASAGGAPSPRRRCDHAARIRRAADRGGRRPRIRLELESPCRREPSSSSTATGPSRSAGQTDRCGPSTTFSRPSRPRRLRRQTAWMRSSRTSGSCPHATTSTTTSRWWSSCWADFAPDQPVPASENGRLARDFRIRTLRRFAVSAGR
jgi:hypothetical protein